MNAVDTSPVAERDAMIRLEGVSFSRGAQPIFSEVDLVVPRGQVTVVLGPSGTGKTTLLRLIGGQVRASRGRVEVDGVNVGRARRRELYALRRRMGVLFQNGALFTDLTVGENVAFPLQAHSRLDPELIDRIVLFKLEAVGLREARDKYPAELSGGMARRAALARAMALDPALMLYDEPFAGQDPVSMGVLLRLIRHLNDALGLTSVVVTHDVQEAMSIADRVVVLAGGRFIGSGTPEEVLAQRDDEPALAQFLDGAPDGPLTAGSAAKSMGEALGLEGRS
ncbi:MAG: ABC transporter ATP-binding protein [Guyparkeria sp.]|uniref:ABC transporter ATP-binding protein n=1 Tax=Guyparkeria sp. TaxID=2035736 RepID=UPI0039787A14